MLGLKNYLKNCLQDKKLIQKYLKQIDITTLIEIIKILQEELKQRIKTFEEKKDGK